jgi:predicted RNA-binding Zn-ribbon protein involved in translation (DUF1610 family)
MGRTISTISMTPISSMSGDNHDEDSAELLPCPACGADIYVDAVACPSCGHYVTRDTNVFR